MKILFIKMFGLLFVVLFAVSVNAGSVCSPQGNITSLIPSVGVAGFSMDVPLGCSCDSDAIWIDTETNGGKVMFSAVLSAKVSALPVRATIEDGNGQGAAGNGSVAYRYWASCKLMALELL